MRRGGGEGKGEVVPNQKPGKTVRKEGPLYNQLPVLHPFLATQIPVNSRLVVFPCGVEVLVKMFCFELCTFLSPACTTVSKRDITYGM